MSVKHKQKAKQRAKISARDYYCSLGQSLSTVWALFLLSVIETTFNLERKWWSPGWSLTDWLTHWLTVLTVSHCKLAANNRCQIITPSQLPKDWPLLATFCHKLALLMSICSKHHREIHHSVSRSAFAAIISSSISELKWSAQNKKVSRPPPVGHRIDSVISKRHCWHWCALFYSYRVENTHSP